MSPDVVAEAKLNYPGSYAIGFHGQGENDEIDSAVAGLYDPNIVIYTSGVRIVPSSQRRLPKLKRGYGEMDFGENMLRMIAQGILPIEPEELQALRNNDLPSLANDLPLMQSGTSKKIYERYRSQILRRFDREAHEE